MTSTINETILEFENRYCVNVTVIYNHKFKISGLYMRRGNNNVSSDFSKHPTEALDMECCLHDAYTRLVGQELDEIRRKIRHAYQH